MKKFKEFVNEHHNTDESYEIDQLNRAEEDHDWKYPMTIKVSGTKNSSKYLSITKKEFEKIKKILSGVKQD